MTSRSPHPKDSFVLLGVVSSAHGLRGELKIRPFTETPENFSRYRRLYLSADDGKTRVPYTSIQSRCNGNTVILRLEGCEKRDQAEKLAGMQIWLACEDLPPLDNDEFYLYTLEGKQVETSDGRFLGGVASLLHTGGADVLVVRDGRKEYLIPAVREFFVAIEEKKVVLALPPGLLEINS